MTLSWSDEGSAGAGALGSSSGSKLSGIPDSWECSFSRREIILSFTFTVGGFEDEFYKKKYIKKLFLEEIFFNFFF